MAQFRKKPVVIEAVPAHHLIADATHNWAGLPQWFRDAYEAGGILIRPERIDIKTLEGVMTAEWADWVICGVKGELYPCKPDIFAATYDFADAPLAGLSFGDAIAALKAGKRVARLGWNGKGMWLAYTPGSEFAPEHAKPGHAAAHRAKEAPGENVRLLPHIDMRAADGSMVIGWLASQTDMLADDWLAVEI